MRLSIRTAAFSFVLSVMLWLYITLQAEYEVTVPVRLDVQLPPQRSLREPLPDRVYVKLRGSGWSLLNAMYLDRSARVVVSIPPHTQHGTIGESELRAGFRSSASVAVAIIEPTAIEYDLGTIVQKKVPLVPNVEYEPADGYVLARRLFVVPDSVVVIGSESVLDTVTHWTTRPLVRKQLRRTTVDVVEVVSADRACATGKNSRQRHCAASCRGDVLRCSGPYRIGIAVVGARRSIDGNGDTPRRNRGHRAPPRSRRGTRIGQHQSRATASNR